MPEQRYDLFIFAGEKSGDLHGSLLLQKLQEQYPAIRVTGVGGPAMRETGMHCPLAMENFQVMGFVDVFLALPRLMRQFYFVKQYILRTQPAVVLLIDYAEFNLRLAAHLRKAGFKGRICHYICPSVWAWGKKRIPRMAATLDSLFSILPFEKSFFSETTLPVHYVGHPLISALHNHPRQPLQNFRKGKILALFPGSRRHELEKNLHLQLMVAKKLREEEPTLQIALSIANAAFLPFIRESIDKAGFQEGDVELIPQERSYDLMQRAHFAIAKSGTVTLELALHGVPTVVTYGISPLDLFIARRVLRIDLPFYCLVNILANEEVFRELFGPHLTFDALYQAAKALLDNPLLHTDCREKCAKVRVLLGEENASCEIVRLLVPYFNTLRTAHEV